MSTSPLGRWMRRVRERALLVWVVRLVVAVWLGAWLALRPPSLVKGVVLAPDALVLLALPLTWLGRLVYVGARVAVWYFGREHQDYVLHVAGVALFGLLVVALLLVSLTALVLWRRRRMPARQAERIEAGQPRETGFALPSLWWLPLVSVDWRWVEPDGVELEQVPRRGRFIERVTFLERGEHTRTVRRIAVGDVFGLCALGLRFVEASPRVVLPARGRPLVAPLVEALAGGDVVSHPAGPPDGDYIEMRRYVWGDPMKRILWKTYARSRQLMVRLPERAVAPTRRTLAYLVAGDGDEPPAGIARLALENGALGPEWRFGADGSDEDARSVEEAVQLIVKSRAARAHQGEGLGTFLDRAADLGAGTFRCVLFVPARPGPWLERVEGALRRQLGSVVAVIGTDGIRDDEGAGARWRRLVLRADDAEARTAARARDLETIAARLGSLGVSVSIVERPTGRVRVRGARRRAA